MSLALAPACADIATAPIPMVTLNGTVTSPSGAPLSRIELRFRRITSEPPILHLARGESNADPLGPGGRRTSAAPEPIPVAVTRPDGTFSIDVAATTYDIYLYAEPRSGIRSLTIVRHTVGREKPRFDFRYSGFEVTGAVTGPGGSPVTNALVVFSGLGSYLYVSTQFDGTSYTALVEPGEYNVYVEPPSPVGGIPARHFPTVFLAADTTIDFALTGHLVTGTVTDPDGASLEQSTVYFDAADAFSGDNTNAAGAYSLYAPTGDYSVYAYPPLERQEIQSRFFDTTDISAPAIVDLQFTGIKWSGVVRAAGSGTPIGGAVVDVVGNRYRYYSYLGKARARAGDDGTFLLHLEGQDRYRITATAPGFGVLRVEDVQAGADSTFDLVLNPAGAP